MVHDALDKDLARACFAEGIATLMFVFIGVGTVSANCQQGWAEPGPMPCSSTGYSLAFGLMITTLAFAIGDLSGGHINPAVTVSMLVTQNISPLRGMLYMVSQCVGGIIGGGLVKLSVGKDHYVSGIGKADFVTPGGAFLIEFMGTLVLIFTVFHVAIWAANVKEHLTSSNTQALAPLPIGFAVLVVHLAIGPLTGCGINPARVIGAVVWQEKEPFPGHHWVYYLGPFLASVVGPLIYFMLYGTVHPNDHSVPEPGAVSKANGKQIEPVLEIQHIES